MEAAVVSIILLSIWIVSLWTLLIRRLIPVVLIASQIYFSCLKMERNNYKTKLPKCFLELFSMRLASSNAFFTMFVASNCFDECLSFFYRKLFIASTIQLRALWNLQIILSGETLTWGVTNNTGQHPSMIASWHINIYRLRQLLHTHTHTYMLRIKMAFSPSSIPQQRKRMVICFDSWTFQLVSPRWLSLHSKAIQVPDIDLIALHLWEFVLIRLFIHH